MRRNASKACRHLRSPATRRSPMPRRRSQRSPVFVNGCPSIATRSRAGSNASCCRGDFNASLTASFTWILDVAHNPAAARALAANLQSMRGAGRTIAVCGMLADKDVPAVLVELREQVDTWVAAATTGARGLDDAELALRARPTGIDMRAGGSVSDAMRLAAGLSQRRRPHRRVRILPHRRARACTARSARPRRSGLESIIRVMDQSLKARLIGASVLVLSGGAGGAGAVVWPQDRNNRTGESRRRATARREPTPSSSARAWRRPLPIRTQRDRSRRSRRRSRPSVPPSATQATARRRARRRHRRARRSFQRRPGSPSRRRPSAVRRHAARDATPEPTAAAAPARTRGTWSVQVGAFGSAESARRLVQTLEVGRIPCLRLSRGAKRQDTASRARGSRGRPSTSGRARRPAESTRTAGLARRK